VVIYDGLCRPFALGVTNGVSKNRSPHSDTTNNIIILRIDAFPWHTKDSEVVKRVCPRALAYRLEDFKLPNRWCSLGLNGRLCTGAHVRPEANPPPHSQVVLPRLQINLVRAISYFLLTSLNAVSVSLSSTAVPGLRGCSAADCLLLFDAMCVSFEKWTS